MTSGTVVIATVAGVLAVGATSSLGAPRAIDTIDDSASASAAAVRVDPPEPPPSTAPPTVVPTGDAAALAEVLELTNAERARAGLPPLRREPRLDAAAQVHSEDMARGRFLSHTGSDGSNTGDRVTRQGYRYRAWAENVAAGYRTAESVMDGWMGSDGHRRNILWSSVDEIGLGIARDANGRPYWTQVFGAEL